MFPLLVKPAGADCNLACGYCFYREKSALYPDTPHPRMSEEVLRALLRQYPAGSIAFQGGEPTLMGEEFFRKAAEWGRGVEFSLQTNGTLVTRSLARFLAGQDWLVGVSIDGAEAIHNRYRQRFDAALAGYRELVAAGAKVNTLTLVSAANIGHAREIYRFLRDRVGSRFHQYIECTTPERFAIDGEKWGDFLIELFDTWAGDGDQHRVSIRLFDSLVSQLVYGHASVCQFANTCRNYLVVEWNGDVYPCDFHVTKELRLGNIMEQSLEEMFIGARERMFGERKRDWAGACDRCEFLPFCHGDCPKNRDPATRQSRLCAGYKRFFAHALPRLEAILKG